MLIEWLFRQTFTKSGEKTGWFLYVLFSLWTWHTLPQDWLVVLVCCQSDTSHVPKTHQHSSSIACEEWWHASSLGLFTLTMTLPTIPSEGDTSMIAPWASGLTSPDEEPWPSCPCSQGQEQRQHSTDTCRTEGDSALPWSLVNSLLSESKSLPRKK